MKKVTELKDFIFTPEQIKVIETDWYSHNLNVEDGWFWCMNELAHCQNIVENKLKPYYASNNTTLGDWLTIKETIINNYKTYWEENKMNKQKRIEVVKAMETLARCINDERVFSTWLSLGVADGDITENTSDEELEFYIENNVQFADLMYTFLRCMHNAYYNGGLYVDNVVSKEEEL